MESEEINQLTKKEVLQLTRERDKLELTLGGIKDMGGLPDMLFVLDTNKEDIAVAEANKLGIPVVAVVDSNASPLGIDFPVPGNDDAMRAISLYCELARDAILDGLQQELAASGHDIGADTVAPSEELVDNTSKKNPKEIEVKKAKKTEDNKSTKQVVEAVKEKSLKTTTELKQNGDIEAEENEDGPSSAKISLKEKSASIQEDKQSSE